MLENQRVLRVMRSCLIGHKNRPFVRKLRACLQGERVTLANGLKIARVYKQISKVGLPRLSPRSTLPALLSCFFMRDILCNVQDLK